MPASSCVISTQRLEIDSLLVPVPTRAAAPPSRVPTTTMPHHLRQGSPCALPPAPARSTEPHPESARLRRLARSVPVPRHTWPCRRSQPFSSGHQLPFTENRCRGDRGLHRRRASAIVPPRGRNVAQQDGPPGPRETRRYSVTADRYLQGRRGFHSPRRMIFWFPGG